MKSIKCYYGKHEWQHTYFESHRLCSNCDKKEACGYTGDDDDWHEIQDRDRKGEIREFIRRLLKGTNEG